MPVMSREVCEVASDGRAWLCVSLGKERSRATNLVCCLLLSASSQWHNDNNRFALNLPLVTHKHQPARIRSLEKAEITCCLVKQPAHSPTLLSRFTRAYSTTRLSKNLHSRRPHEDVAIRRKFNRGFNRPSHHSQNCSDISNYERTKLFE
jgi:hypothetical protein